MCGRFTLGSPDELLTELGLAGAFSAWRGSYNAAPGQDLPCIVNRQELGERARFARWGLVPHWAKDASAPSKWINARSETLADKAAFRGAYLNRRSLIPADGFFEWRRDGDSRSPFYFRRRDHKPFAFAGLWEHHRIDSDTWQCSFAIVTKAASGQVAAIHDRMPVIVSPADYSRWLCADSVEPAALDDICVDASCADFESFEVSRLVNSVKNDGPELITPGAAQLALF